VIRARTGGWLAVLVALGLAYSLFGHWLTTAQGRALLGGFAPYLPWIYFAQNVAMFVALGAWFGASLRPGRDALVTRFARFSGECLSPAGIDYTRQVTIAWTLFFAIVATASVALFFLAPLELWSTFANLLTLPLVGAMFVAEYAVRTRACPELARGGLARGVLRSVRAYWESTARPTTGPR
jgi:uncharacterized membrane protein